MNGNITQPTAVAVEAFIEAVEHAGKREDAKVLDALFRRITGIEPKMWGPTIIGYGAYRTTYDSGRAVHWMRTSVRSCSKFTSLIWSLAGMFWPLYQLVLCKWLVINAVLPSAPLLGDLSNIRMLAIEVLRHF